jgi:hypothetical protein
VYVPKVRCTEECRLLGPVALVRTDVLEEHSAPVIRVTRIGKLGTTLAVTSNRGTLQLILGHLNGLIPSGFTTNILCLHLRPMCAT